MQIHDDGSRTFTATESAAIRYLIAQLDDVVIEHTELAENADVLLDLHSQCCAIEDSEVTLRADWEDALRDDAERGIGQRLN